MRFYFVLVIIDTKECDYRARLPPLQYSSKNVILYQKYEELVAREIKRVKILPGTTTP